MKPTQSSPIRKGKLSADEITRIAEEFTKNQLTTTGSAIKTYKTIVETKAPEVEPVQKGDYKLFAETLKKAIKESGQFEATTDQLKLFFPQVRRGGRVATNLKRNYGISYRRIEGGRNDTYVFFIEPTREELIVQLTSAESKVIELEGLCNVWIESHRRLDEEINQLKSDLFYSQRSNIITLIFAIGVVLTIIFKSVAL